MKTLEFILKTLLLSTVMLLVTIIISMFRPLSAEGNTTHDEGTIMLLLLSVTTVYAFVIGIVIKNARGSRLQLILGLMIAFYGVQTVIGQIEAIFFLTSLGEKLGAGSAPVLQMPLHFIVSQFIVWGAVTLVGIPLAVVLYDRRKNEKRAPVQWIPKMSNREWLSKLGILIIAYELLYFGFGYFMAWKNPVIQAFYQGTDPGSFFAQLANVAKETPGLYGLQAFRSLLWLVIAFPVISMLSHKRWLGAIMTGLFVSLPMNIPHIIPNPYMPADVRAIHFTETVISNFIFGVLLFWLFRSKPTKQISY
ncbi:MAG: hypothetical protein K9H26_09185 [Prolixibacteraceae bacterium]|nr:hypothetical protein [Prolixibacteraceae bacterium]